MSTVSKPITECPVKPHKTIVCGWDENKKLVYMHTFDYENDKEEKELAQAAFAWCIDNCHAWMISDIDEIIIGDKNQD